MFCGGGEQNCETTIHNTEYSNTEHFLQPRSREATLDVLKGLHMCSGRDFFFEQQLPMLHSKLFPETYGNVKKPSMLKENNELKLQ